MGYRAGILNEISRIPALCIKEASVKLQEKVCEVHSFTAQTSYSRGFVSFKLQDRLQGDVFA